MTAYDRIIDTLERRGSTVRRRGDRKAVAQCPAHDDRNPSLSVTNGAGLALVHCFAGCEVDDILAALKLGLADLYDEPRGRRYDYYDAAGATVLRTVTRTPTKKFSQKVHEPDAVTLYRLPEVVAAVADDRRVWLVEGEKDADNIVVLAGEVATSAPMGSSNFSRVDTRPLHGANVVAVVDRDNAGARWAADVRAALDGHANLEFRRAATGKDVSDHLAAGHGLDELERYEMPVEPGEAPAGGFNASHPIWDARKVLGVIRGHARASGVNPFAVLPVVLARVLGHMPPQVVLPPLGHASRGHASLNTFTALVAWSGGGKGLVNAAAVGAVDIPEDAAGRRVVSAPLGSGEGLVEWFARRGDVKEGEDSVVFLPNAPILDAPEVDHFGALVARDGSTLASVLRTAWSGELLGTSNRASSGNRLTVPAHTYRLALVLGVQPLRARKLLADAAGGTPQRFVWASSEDPTLPDDPVFPPGPVEWIPPEMLPDVDRAGLRPLGMDDSVAAELWAAHVTRRRGQVRDDDGQANLVRLKLAAGLAILDRRITVTAEDWELAGVLSASSASTLAGIRAALDDASRRSNRARAEADAERAVTVAERVASAEVERTCNYVLRQLGKDPGGMTRWALNRAAGSRYRPHLVDALDVLTEGGHIVVESIPGQGQEGTLYRLRGEARTDSSGPQGRTKSAPASAPQKPRNFNDSQERTRGADTSAPGSPRGASAPVIQDERRAS